MAKVNELKCVKNLRNTGFDPCVFDPKLIAGVLLYPNGRTFTDQEIDDLQATLEADAVLDDKLSRMYPLHKFVSIADNQEDVTIQTFDYGAKSVVKDGDYDATFQYLDGALTLHAALRSHNGPTPFLMYDKKRNIIGTSVNGKLSTIPPHFFHALPWKFATGSTVAGYLVRLSFLPEYVNEELAFVAADFDLKDIKGLKDVEVVVNSFNAGTGVANVTLQTAGNKTNLYDRLSVAFNNIARYAANNLRTGGAITVSNVALAANKTFDITLNTANTDYPAAGGTVLLNLAVPSILSQAAIDGYEGIEAEIAISAS